MNTLSEKEIRNLFNDLKKSFLSYLEYLIDAKEEAIKEYDSMQEKKNQKLLEDYHSAQAKYEADLKAYEEKVAKKEAEYNETIKRWEISNLKTKESVEKTNIEITNAFIKAKKEYEAATGKPYYQKEPHLLTFRQSCKPKMAPVYGKPHPVTPPVLCCKYVPGKTNWYNVDPVINKKTLYKKIRSLGFLSLNESLFTSIDILQQANSNNLNELVKEYAYDIYRNHRIDSLCKFKIYEEMSSAERGLIGEINTVIELELCVLKGFKGEILHNLEFRTSGSTNQTDIIFVTPKGIFVIENKNYSGSIHGADNKDKWELRTYRKNYYFNNPIRQNQTHINHLSCLAKTQYYSVVVFENECSIEYMDIHQKNTFVLKRNNLKDLIKDIFSSSPDVMTQKEIEEIVTVLKKYCADNPASPNYKEKKSYYSSTSTVENDSNEYNHYTGYRSKRRYSQSLYFDSDYDDDNYDYYEDEDDDYDYDDDYD